MTIPPISLDGLVLLAVPSHPSLEPVRSIHEGCLTTCSRNTAVVLAFHATPACLSPTSKSLWVLQRHRNRELHRQRACGFCNTTASIGAIAVAPSTWSTSSITSSNGKRRRHQKRPAQRVGATHINEPPRHQIGEHTRHQQLLERRKAIMRPPALA